jgi:hypothetical protein
VVAGILIFLAVLKIAIQLDIFLPEREREPPLIPSTREYVIAAPCHNKVAEVIVFKR